MAELSDIVTLTTISSTRANEWQDRLVQRYSSVANRTTEHPTPSEGDLSYLEDANALDVYTGAAWVPVFLTNEVDGSVEVGTSTQLTTTPTAYATVNLTIPTGWATWKCEAHATFSVNQNTDANGVTYRIRIDGTDQQALVLAQSVGVTAIGFAGSVGGRRTGMTTTGSRVISLMASVATGTTFINDIYLYARAVRTS